MSKTGQKLIALSTPATQEQVEQVQAMKVVKDMNPRKNKSTRAAERTIALWKDSFGMSNEEVSDYATRFPCFKNVEEYLNNQGE